MGGGASSPERTPPQLPRRAVGVLGRRRAEVRAAVAKSVREKPGSTIVTPMPNDASSAAADSQNPSIPHFVAW